MDKITKPIARKFFELPRQTVLEDNGKLIAKMEAYITDSKMVNLKEEDIKHLDKRHFSGWDIDDSIYSHETGERLEYLDGIGMLEEQIFPLSQFLKNESY